MMQLFFTAQICSLFIQKSVFMYILLNNRFTICTLFFRIDKPKIKEPHPYAAPMKSGPDESLVELAALDV